MAKLGDLLANLDRDVRALVDREWTDLKAEAGRDASALLEMLKPDLQKWAAQLEAGKLEMDDVEYMIGSRRERAELQELKRLGLSQAKRDKLVNGVVELVTKALSKLG